MVDYAKLFDEFEALGHGDDEVLEFIDATKELPKEWKRLKTMETEISVLVAEGSNMDAGSEYFLECMENMLVGGPYERTP